MNKQNVAVLKQFISSAQELSALIETGDAEKLESTMREVSASLPQDPQIIEKTNKMYEVLGK
jgi:prephenate dehydrogenase